MYFCEFLILVRGSPNCSGCIHRRQFSERFASIGNSSHKYRIIFQNHKNIFKTFENSLIQERNMMRQTGP